VGRYVERSDKVKIHEYQAKEMFAKYGIPVPKGDRPRPIKSLQSSEGEW
jgi:succinyl-CoA synthetase beta subunit